MPAEPLATDEQASLIAFLSTPEAYAGVVDDLPDTVDQVETHISAIFLVGAFAFKLKRAVRYPYLDFSTLERRERYCRREVEINSRTAPDVYLGVLPVTREPGMDGGYRIGGEGPAVDWLVHMRRFDDRRLYDRLVENGEIGRHEVTDLAATVAEFHGASEIRGDAGAADALAATIDGNEESFSPHCGSVFDDDAVRALFAEQRARLADLDPVLRHREQEGRVRHCHGDLHLGNIFMEDGHPVLFDAIEFNDAFSDIDVFYDLAFLVMDLDCRAGRRLANMLVNRYLDETGDIDGLSVFPLFLSLRAAIRAHVSATAAGHQDDPSDAERLVGRARDYLSLASDYLEPAPVRLVAVGGLSGSGKSHLAREIASRIGVPPGARVVRTDVMRKRLAGVQVLERLPPESYTRAASERVYDACMAEARTVLGTGYSVVLDAVFARAEERRAARNLATQAGVVFDGLWLEASAKVMAERIRERSANASDATVGVLEKQLGYDFGVIDWQRIDSGGTRQATTEAAAMVLGLVHAPGSDKV